MYNNIYNSYNASSQDYADMSRNASREFYDMERARAIKKANTEKNDISCSLEKANILKECELGLITKDECLTKIKNLEQETKEKKFTFFR